ncbi:MAG: carboxypeptidase regulatory-like domain-containing protein [Planctomycetia bacterium]|nr:carboxypeptidase regulatory-like domain-containing protein [Planctomycetia bacterium]
MKIDRRMCWIVSVLTLVTSVTPVQELVAGDRQGHAEQPDRAARNSPVVDVELMPGGILAGQVVDSSGRPDVGQAIVVRQSTREPIVTFSDQAGRFRVSGLSAGLCQIAHRESAIACRCWSPRTAPPAAERELLLTSGATVERGQRPFADLLCGPVLIGMIIGAAIAIPIAIHNSKKSAS